MSGQDPDLHARRRAFLKAASVTAIAGLAGCPLGGPDGPASETPPPTDWSPTPQSTPDESSELAGEYADRFETIVDVVDAGADPGGDRPINDVVRENAEEDTLLVFPGGTYAFEPDVLSLPANFGLVAAKGANPALLPMNLSPASEWFEFTDADRFVLDGIDFEYRPLDAMGGTVIRGPGPITIRNLYVHGEYRTIDEQLMRIDVTDADGEGVVENLVARGVDEREINTTGLYVGREHAGTLTVRNCRLERFSDNAVYASPPGGEGGAFDAAGGTVHVHGGLFRNNNIAAIRLGSTGSTVDGATVIVDETPPTIDESSLNARGIRLRGQHGQRVENCRLVYRRNAGHTEGAITVHGSNGAATIRNVVIEMDLDDVCAIRAKEPTIGGDGTLTFENVRVDGEAARGQAVSVTGRPGTGFRNCCIRQSGRDRDGIRLVDSQSCSVVRSQIDVSGTPVVLRNSSLVSGYRPQVVCSE